MTTNFMPEWDTVTVAPAPADLVYEMPATRAEQMAFFNANGFLLVRGLLSAELLADVEKDLAYCCAHHETMKPVREGFNVEDPAKWPDPNTPVFRKVGGLYDHSQAWRRVAEHCCEQTILTDLLGDRIKLWRDVVMMKQAQVGREKPWHQDGVYWPYRPFKQVSAFCALDACTRENGALQVIPGTHLSEREHFGRELQVELSAEEQAAARYVIMQPGDVLLFHSLLLHGSEPNGSDQHRRVAINSYIADGLTYTGNGREPVCPVVVG